jgi:DMSO/TMAO reductase YedYZ molybdopterin-dependent catalytic subunit
MIKRIPEVPDEAATRARVPPGQAVTTRFYALTAEEVPVVDTTSLVITVHGEVERPVSLQYAQLMTLPHLVRSADFHCVEGWSVLGTTWGGVAVADVLKATGVVVKPTARFVMVECVTGYTTNLPLDVLMDPETMLVWEWNGLPLPPEHGGPLRLLVPSLYAWKDAKWVQGFEFMTEDRAGFWESRGYHMHGDPWKQERYS